MKLGKDALGFVNSLKSSLPVFLVGLALCVPALALLFVSDIVHAQTNPAFNASGGSFGTSLQNLVMFINARVIPFLIAIGFLAFVWGMFWYFIAGGANEDKREKGRMLMIYAVIGFVAIFILWGVVFMLAESTGLQRNYLNTQLLPTAPTTNPSGFPQQSPNP